MGRDHDDIYGSLLSLFSYIVLRQGTGVRIPRCHLTTYTQPVIVYDNTTKGLFMAHGKVLVSNETTGQRKLLPVGFSWTVLFWGFFPAIFRQDWKNLAIIGGVLLVASLIGLGIIPLIIFSFIYNDKMCLKDHLDSGWKIVSYNGSKSLYELQNSIGYDLDRYMKQ